MRENEWFPARGGGKVEKYSYSKTQTELSILARHKLIPSKLNISDL
jgi:hypothetical protein